MSLSFFIPFAISTARGLSMVKVAIVVEHIHSRTRIAEELPAHFHLLNNSGRRFGAIGMTANGLRPQAERAFRGATAACVEGNIGVLQVADEILLDLEIAVINGEDARHRVPVNGG